MSLSYSRLLSFSYLPSVAEELKGAAKRIRNEGNYMNSFKNQPVEIWGRCTEPPPAVFGEDWRIVYFCPMMYHSLLSRPGLMAELSSPRAESAVWWVIEKFVSKVSSSLSHIIHQAGHVWLDWLQLSVQWQLSHHQQLQKAAQWRSQYFTIIMSLISQLQQINAKMTTPL